MQCDKEAFNRFFHAMLAEGIYLAPSAYEAGFVSAAHGEAEIGRTVGAAKKGFCRLARLTRSSAPLRHGLESAQSGDVLGQRRDFPVRELLGHRAHHAVRIVGALAPPRAAVNIEEYAIGMHASSLIRDGGTLQLGIGALGDAFVRALQLRQTYNDDYVDLLDALCGSEAARHHNVASAATPKVDVCEKKYVFNRTPVNGGTFSASAACPPSELPASLASASAAYQLKYDAAFAAALE